MQIQIMSKFKDIAGREDIELLISKFYEKILDDIIIGFIFRDIAKINLDTHLPVICDFWETILFHNAKYKKGPEVINVHLELNKKIKLKNGHFRRWLYLFHTTVDEYFEGERAYVAKQRASSIAESMQKRISQDAKMPR